ncbi:MAG: hypothetical protein IKM43_03720 [Clostridia bacterium]|nr:hypothetical protein [Clostridia bacterium]
MTKFKFINLIDKLFISVSLFLIIYAWINFYLRDLWTTFILSLIFTFASLFLIFYFFNKKSKSKSLKKQEQNDIEKYFFAFRLYPKQKKLELLKSILDNQANAVINNGALHYNVDNLNHVLLIATSADKIDNNNLVDIIENFIDNDVDIIEIVCNNAINLDTEILNNKEIKIINRIDLYKNFFKKYDVYPDTSFVNLHAKKFDFKKLMSNFFLPQKAKSYFVCGLVLIFSSIILPYHFYYVVFASILLLFAIICKLKNFVD